eukprot:4358715-Lingulodinium_polyedra.AAC.1
MGLRVECASVRFASRCGSESSTARHILGHASVQRFTSIAQGRGCIGVSLAWRLAARAFARSTLAPKVVCAWGAR